VNHICFFGIDNYRMLAPAASERPVNGEAVQQVLLARAFRDLGYRVSMVVRESGNHPDHVVEGIRVLRAFNWHDGLPGIRFLHPRASGVIKALRKIDADIYYQSPAGVFTGITAAFCKWKNRKFVFRIASDANCVPGEQLIEFWRDRKLFEYGLRRADLIAVQSYHQMGLLKANYGLESKLVNMVMELPMEPIGGKRDIDVLWVNNLRAVKRAECVLSVAAQLTQYDFVMIGGALPGSEDYFESIAQKASQMPNVKFLGQVPYDAVNRYIARSKILLNTSVVEGFPNSFLQAWARKVPVVSFFDPDQIITREGLGIRPRTEKEMCAALYAVLEDSGKREEMGNAARRYALAHFTPDSAARRYIELCRA